MKNIVGCIVLKENNILILKKKGKDYWEIPGKPIRENEDMELAAKNAVYNLTGLTINIVQQFNESQSYYDGNEFLSHLFEANIVKGNIKDNPEMENIEFFPIEELPKLKMSNILASIYQELKK